MSNRNVLSPLTRQTCLIRSLISAIRLFLSCYDRFLESRTIEANKALNTSVERLRDLITEYDMNES